MWAMRTNRKRNICRGANHVLGAGRRTNHVRDAEDQSHEGCRSVDQSHLTTSGALAGEGPDQGGGGAQGRAWRNLQSNHRLYYSLYVSLIDKTTKPVFYKWIEDPTFFFRRYYNNWTGLK
jgi:hypothetical protein